MNRTAFEYLFIHANSLAELGMEQMIAALAPEMPEAAGQPAPPGAGEGEALALAQLDKLESSSMMDGFAWETPEHDAAVQNMLEQLQAATVSAPGSPWAGAPGEPVNGEAGLVLYLQQAYAVPDQIALRVDLAMGRIDMAGLSGLLAGLPGELAPLTGALRAEDLAQWLACYQAGHGALIEIVALCRDAGFAG